MSTTARKPATARELEMRGLLDEARSSGVSLKAVSEKHGIPYTTLQCWKRRIAAIDHPASPKESAPIELAAVHLKPPADAPPFELVTSFGALRIRSGFDSTELTRLLAILKDRY